MISSRWHPVAVAMTTATAAWLAAAGLAAVVWCGRSPVAVGGHVRPAGALPTVDGRRWTNWPIVLAGHADVPGSATSALLISCLRYRYMRSCACVIGEATAPESVRQTSADPKKQPDRNPPNELNHPLKSQHHRPKWTASA